MKFTLLQQEQSAMDVKKEAGLRKGNWLNFSPLKALHSGLFSMYLFHPETLRAQRVA